MITETLSLRFRDEQQRPPCAWYVPGDQPSEWLAEIATWDVRHAETRLCLVPMSASDRRAIGVLVTSSADLAGSPSPRAVPFGCFAQRLYLPVNAWLAPDVSEAELGELLDPSAIYVWHPAAGLVAFAPHDVRRLDQLLMVSPAAPRQWDRAQVGFAFPSRLNSLLPDETLTIEMIRDDGRGDIGDKAGEIQGLPPSPQEAKPGVLPSAMRGAERAAASIARWLAQHAPNTASHPTWVNKLGDWAEGRLERISAGLQAARNREISRLMHMLETNPDEGLKFALPLNGDAHRGIGPPGTHLGNRSIDFSLSRLGGGGPADLWDIGCDYQRQLKARYRELASREIRLGRHRRAAYIYAELLGDFDAAANALAAGQHFREAALLYRERLRRPIEAAKCLEQGGLWLEAIELYVGLGQHEKAGDLYLTLDRTVDGHQQYRLGIDAQRKAGNFLGAAKLLEEKLGARDEALATLDAGWPTSSQAAACLRASFEFLGRHGWHAEANGRLASLRRHTPNPGRSVTVVEVVAEVANGYPDRDVMQQAGDCVRTHVASGLPHGSQQDRRKLLAAFDRLVPEDRLLTRDCQRYLLRHQLPRPKTTLPAQNARAKRPQLVETLHLPEGIAWQRAVLSGGVVYVAGIGDGEFTKDKLCLVRSNWQRVELPGKMWHADHRTRANPILLAAGANHLLVHFIGSEPLTSRQTFPASDICHEAVQAGSISGVCFETIGATSARRIAASWDHHWSAELQTGGVVLRSIGEAGEAASAVTLDPMTLPEDAPNTPALPLPMHAGRQLFVGLFQSLIAWSSGDEPVIFNLRRRITSIFGSDWATRMRVGVTFEQGGRLFWDDIEAGPSAVFASDMTDPVACINRGGYLVAANRSVCEVYSTSNGCLTLQGAIELAAAASPIAVLPGPRSHQFGIVYADGRIELYEMP